MPASQRRLHYQLHFIFGTLFFLQLTRWRGPGQTWRVRGNIFVAQIRSETPPDMFLILPLLCSATDTPIFCTSGNTHIPSHTDTVRVCWKQSIFSKKKKKKKKTAHADKNIFSETIQKQKKQGRYRRKSKSRDYEPDSKKDTEVKRDYEPNSKKDTEVKAKAGTTSQTLKRIQK